MVAKLIAAAIAAITIAGASPASAEPYKINIATVLASAQLPLYVAKDKGFFEKNNVDATITLLPVSGQGPAALAAGQVQVSMVPVPNGLSAKEGGIDLVFVTFASVFSSGNDTAVIARTGLGAKTAKDLEGKKIGVPALMGGSDISFRKWLKVGGADLAKVTFIETPIPQMRDLIRNGTVDAVVTFEPVMSTLVDSGEGYILSKYLLDIVPRFPAATFASLRSWAVANPDAVKAMRKGLDDAIAWIKANPEETREVEKKWLKAAATGKYPEFTTGMTVDDFKWWVDVGTEFGTLKTKMDPASAMIQ